ncbi:tryptophan 7-halogenase [Pseudoalteromonas sp. JBTF-M23]|uniref:Tryptophan 7-halogenase n=1 Tax=Pseudoalteromonas caenipelagi TaxID=2726988 RepID=A0A849VDM4_9GAMM|nr:tryptophan halogenase family protein [Pseudoalteromonas caenipelagi]NOU50880.1 tryptophan 7-halogenase [Pseudoalteromonas caenipelagi]
MNQINNIVIVGGGTAGWISAALLAKKLNASSQDGVSITLVESPDIPIIGVGEGTWPTIRKTLQEIGIAEDEFIKECDASFKQGAEFVNWYQDPAKIGKHSYFHPLNATFHAAYDFNLAPYWLLDEAENKQPYDLACATQSYISSQGFAPKSITTPQYDAILNYSYHLNANKFAKLLTKHAVKLGVHHIQANIHHVHVDTAGFVKSVDTDTHGTVAGDFFIDCSGSKAIVLGEALGIKWKSISDIIFNDTALAVQVPYEKADSPIASNTIATAQAHGWTWDIGLQNRRGVGYVYSSAHTSEEHAYSTLVDYLGMPESDLSIRKLSLNLGYRQKFWHKNCVAVGMSAAFIEPLEASAIFLIEAAVNMIAEQFPRHVSELEYVEKQFNDTFTLRWEKSVDFIKLHYCISQRRDTQYWVDNVAQSSIPQSLQQKLQHWRYNVPSKYDFDYAFEPFVLDSYLFVLYGLKYNTDLQLKHSSYVHAQLANKKFNDVARLNEHLSSLLPTNRDLLEKILKNGLSKI